MSVQSDDEKKKNFKAFVKFSCATDGLFFNDEQIEAGMQGIDFHQPPEETPAVIAYEKTKARVGRDGANFAEVFKEEFEAANKNANKKL